MPADRNILSELPGSGRVLIAFSGGPDSVCLLHLATLSGCRRRLHCLHVDHQLDAHSGQRARQAVHLAEALGSSCDIVRVDVAGGRGPEGDARAARYSALEDQMDDNETLLTAHHADDQVETVLLRLIRGAGPQGLAGIPARRRFGPGWLARPLLEWRRADIEAWLERHGLESIRDPANDCPDFDRNHLRVEVLPSLRRRWPGVDHALLRSARLCGGAADVIARSVRQDLAGADADRDSLRLADLRDQGDYYIGEAIRAWCIGQGFTPPPGRRLESFLAQIRRAADDRQPALRWHSNVLRLWRGRLWLEAERELGCWRSTWDGRSPLALPGSLGQLGLDGPPGAKWTLEVRSGQAGESLRLAADRPRVESGRLLAAAGVPPWQRRHWPRVWLDGRLVALGDEWLDHDFARQLAEQGRRLWWQRGTRRLIGSGVESGA